MTAFTGDLSKLTDEPVSAQVPLNAQAFTGDLSKLTDKPIAEPINAMVSQKAKDIAGDLGIALAQGFSSSAKGMSGLVDIVTEGLSHAPVVGGGIKLAKNVLSEAGMPTTLTGGLKKLGVDFDAADQAGEQLKSAEFQKQKQENEAEWNKGSIEGLVDTVTSPQLIADMAVKSAPDMATLALGARKIAAGVFDNAMEKALASGLGKEAAQDAAETALKDYMPRLMKISAGAEAAQSAGHSAGDSAGDGDLSGTDAAKAVTTGAATYAGGRLAGKVLGDAEAGSAVDSLTGRAGSYLAAKGKRVGQEALEEGLQNPLEAAAGNAFSPEMRDAIESRDTAKIKEILLRGTGRAAIEGAIVGGAMGGLLPAGSRRVDSGQDIDQIDAESIGDTPMPEDSAVQEPEPSTPMPDVDDDLRFILDKAHRGVEKESIEFAAKNADKEYKSSEKRFTDLLRSGVTSGNEYNAAVNDLKIARDIKREADKHLDYSKQDMMSKDDIKSLVSTPESSDTFIDRKKQEGALSVYEPEVTDEIVLDSAAPVKGQKMEVKEPPIENITLESEPDIDPELRSFVDGLKQNAVDPRVVEIKNRVKESGAGLKKAKAAVQKLVNSGITSGQSYNQALSSLQDASNLHKYNNERLSEINPEPKVSGKAEKLPVSEKKESKTDSLFDRPVSDDTLLPRTEGYDAAQNRNREKAANISQVRGIANNPDYGRMSVSRSPIVGAPMVYTKNNDDSLFSSIGIPEIVTGSDGRKIKTRYAVVEADKIQSSNDANGKKNDLYGEPIQEGVVRSLNNGRSIGIKSAYKLGNAASYRSELLEDAERLGISKQDINNMKNPVLVRVYDENDNKGDMGAWSNEKAGNDLSASEQARNDARLMDDYSGIVLDDEGGFDITKNDELVLSFFRKIPVSEVSGLTNDDGEIIPAAVGNRIINAMIYSAYGEGDILSTATETSDNKNMVKMLATAAPAVSVVPKDDAMGIRPLIVNAFDMLKRAKKKGTSVKEYGRQKDMTRDYSPEEMALADFVDRNYNKPKLVGSVLSLMASYSNSASSYAEDIFGGSLENTKEAAFNFANEKLGELGHETRIKKIQYESDKQRNKDNETSKDGGFSGRSSQGVSEKPEGFVLESQTEDGLAEKERREQDEKTAQAASDKALADSARDIFTLGTQEGRAGEQLPAVTPAATDMFTQKRGGSSKAKKPKNKGAKLSKHSKDGMERKRLFNLRAAAIISGAGSNADPYVAGNDFDSIYSKLNDADRSRVRSELSRLKNNPEEAEAIIEQAYMKREKIRADRRMAGSRERSDRTNASIESNAPKKALEGMVKERVSVALESIGEGLSKKMLHVNGLIDVVSLKDIPNAVRVQFSKEDLAEAKAVYDPQYGRVYIIAENIHGGMTNKELVGLLKHEIGVHALMTGKDGQNMRKVIDDAKKMLSSGDAKMQDARDSVPESTEDDQIDEEMLAYFIEQNPDNSFSNKVVSVVRGLIRKFLPNTQYTKGEIINMVHKAMIDYETGSDTFREGEYAFRSSTIKNIVKKNVDDRSIEAVRSKLKIWLTKERGLTSEDFGSYRQGLDYMFAGNNVVVKHINNKMRDAWKKHYGSKDMLSNPRKAIEVKRYIEGFREGINLPQDIKSIADEMRTVLDGYSSEVQQTLFDNTNYQIDAMNNEERKLFSDYIHKQSAIRNSNASAPQKHEAVSSLIKETIKESSATRNGEHSPVSDAIKYIEMIETIQANKGRYVNRAYQAHNDKDWMRKILREDGLTKEQVKNGDWRKNIVDQKRYDAAKEDIIKANPNATDEEAYLAIQSILREANDVANPMAHMASSQLIKKLGVFKGRTLDDMPGIRHLLGEYHDASFSFANTVGKQLNIIASHKFLKGVRENGLKSGMLSKTRTPNQPYEITGEGMNPLTGLYTSKDYYDALNDVLHKDKVGKSGSALLWLTSHIKAGKTVFSPGTAILNVLSNTSAALGMGHLSPSSMAKTISIMKDYAAGKKEAVNLVKNLSEAGVISGSVFNHEVSNFMKNQNKDFTKKQNQNIEDIKDFSNAVLNGFETFYEWGDSAWKINGYLSEMEKHADKARAIDRVKNGYPNYSTVPKVVDVLKRSPVFSDFPSFIWEQYRTTGHQFKWAMEDAKKGDYRGIARFLAARALLPAAASLLSGMAGWDDDEKDKYMEKFGAPWDKNASMIFLPKAGDNTFSVVNLGRYGMYDIQIRALKALSEGKPVEALREATDGLTGIEMTWKALAEAYTGRAQGGGDIWLPTDDNAEIARKAANHLWRRLGPTALVGVTSNLMDANASMINEALDGTPLAKYGIEGNTKTKRFTNSNVLASLFGARTQTIQPLTAITNGLVGRKQDVLSDANGLRALLGSQSFINDDQIAEKTRDFLEERDKTLSVASDNIKFLREGDVVKHSALVSAIKAGQVSKDDVSRYLRGDVPRWEPSKDFIDKVTSSSRSAGVPAADVGRRIRAMRKEVSAYYREKALQSRESSGQSKE